MRTLLERPRGYRLLLMLAPAVLLASSAMVALSPETALADDEWSIAMSADAGSDGSNHFLEFGTRSGATAGFDSDGTDIPGPPPAPGAAFGASFRITDAVFPQLNADYREMLPAASGASITWTLAVSSAVQPIALTWSDPTGAGLPSDVSLALAGSSATLNMRSSTTATFPAGTHTLTITVSRGTSPTTVPTTPSSVPSDDEDSSDEDGQENTGNGTDSASASDSDSEPNGITPEQQGIRCTGLSVEPAQAMPGQEVAVSATICNPGEANSSATVTLELNGEPVESRILSLSGGGCRQIVFKVARSTPGACEVSIGGMTGSFSVLNTSGTAPTTVPAPAQRGIDTTGLAVLIPIVAVLVTAIILVLRRH